MKTEKVIESCISHKSEVVREIVFLSHANPQDNDFEIWLGARLTELGYEIWSDIGDIIRKKAAKVVLCLSQKASIKKT